MGVIRQNSRLQLFHEITLDAYLLEYEEESEVEAENDDNNNCFLENNVNIMTRRGTRRQRKHQEERMAKKTQKFIKEMKIDMNMMKSKRMGSRKLRRYENAQLLYLSVDENDICEDYSDIAQTTETSLSKLFDNKENMEAWNTFIEKDEEDQRKYLENVKMEEINKQCCSCDDHSTLEAKILEHRPCQIHSYLPNTAFFGLNRRIRIMLKHKNLPLEFMTELENELRSFFCKNVPPVLEWSSSVLTRWQRFIIHTISDYLSLSSKSFIVDGRGSDEKFVKVRNKFSQFWPPADALVDYLKHMREANRIN